MVGGRAWGLGGLHGRSTALHWTPARIRRPVGRIEHTTHWPDLYALETRDKPQALEISMRLRQGLGEGG